MSGRSVGYAALKYDLAPCQARLSRFDSRIDSFASHVSITQRWQRRNRRRLVMLQHAARHDKHDARLSLLLPGFDKPLDCDPEDLKPLIGMNGWLGLDVQG